MERRGAGGQDYFKDFNTPLAEGTYWGIESQRGHTNHLYTPCRDIERVFFKCLEKVGAERSGMMCADIKHDFNECRYHTMRKKRYEAMAAERRRQKRAYIDPPPADSLTFARDQV